MFNRIKSGITARISPTSSHLSWLRSDLRSRLGHFRHHRSVSEQGELTEDFNRVLTAWGIDEAAAIPGVVRILHLRFLVFAAPVIVCAVAALLLQSFVSILTLAFVALPCLVGIITTAWRIFILKNCRFVPLFRWLLSCGGVFRP